MKSQTRMEAEIRSLEAQINPHCLYNTLDAINWVAIGRKEYTVSRMLTSLATILRYSIHLSNEVVTIRDELEYLKKYVYLQQHAGSLLRMVGAGEEDAGTVCQWEDRWTNLTSGWIKRDSS